MRARGARLDHGPTRGDGRALTPPASAQTIVRADGPIHARALPLRAPPGQLPAAHVLGGPELGRHDGGDGGFGLAHPRADQLTLLGGRRDGRAGPPALLRGCARRGARRPAPASSRAPRDGDRPGGHGGGARRAHPAGHRRARRRAVLHVRRRHDPWARAGRAPELRPRRGRRRRADERARAARGGAARGVDRRLAGRGLRPRAPRVGCRVPRRRRRLSRRRGGDAARHRRRGAGGGAAGIGVAERRRLRQRARQRPDADGADDADGRRGGAGVLAPDAPAEPRPRCPPRRPRGARRDERGAVDRRHPRAVRGLGAASRPRAPAACSSACWCSSGRA